MWPLCQLGVSYGVSRHRLSSGTRLFIMLATKGIAIMNGSTEQGVCEDAEKCNPMVL